MRTADVLEELTLEQIRRIARSLGFSISGGSKSQVISGIARALPRLTADDGAALGWQGALRALLLAMQKEELVRAIDGEWSSGDGCWFETRTSEIRRRTVEELRTLLLELCLAEDEDPSVMVSDVVRKARWRDCFDLVEDDEEGDEDEEPESEEPEELAYGAATPAPPTPVVITAGAPGQDRDERPDLAHQLEADRHLATWFRGPERGGVLCMPTGSGKTRTAARFLVRHAVTPGTTVLWLAHRSELVDQAVRALELNAYLAGRSLRIGRFESGRRKVSEPVDVVVASIPTLAHGRNFPGLKKLFSSQRPLGLIVVDECHHAAARTWRGVLQAIENRAGRSKLLGLSATPTRTNEAERSTLWNHFNRIVYEAHALELIHRKVLARPKFIGVPTNKTYQATEKQKAEFLRFRDLPASLVRAIAEEHGRNELIVSYFLQRAAQFGPTLIFTATIAQAEQVHRLLARSGASSAVLSSHSTTQERTTIINAFAQNRLQVLVNVSLFAEGTDLPKVSTVFIARPTTSRILFAQMVGRGLRGPAMNGTEECTIVSFHDTVTDLATEQFATTFREEQEAFDALGLSARDEELPKSVLQPARSTVIPELPGDAASEAALQARMQALLQALTSDVRIHSIPDVVPIPLLGWWRLEIEQHRHYLPVYGPDEQMIAGLLSQARATFRPDRAVPISLVPPPGCIPVEHLAAFVEKYVRGPAEPVFVSLADTSSDEQAAFARSMLAGGAERLLPLQPQPGPAPVAAAPSEAGPLIAPQPSIPVAAAVTDAPSMQTLPVVGLQLSADGAAASPRPAETDSAPTSLSRIYSSPEPQPPAASRHSGQDATASVAPSSSVLTPAAAEGPRPDPAQPAGAGGAPHVSGIPASVPPRSTMGEDDLEVDGPHGVLRVSQRTFAAVTDAWKAYGPILPPGADETARRVFVAMALRMPGLSEHKPQLVEALLTHASTHGSMPMARLAPPPPELLAAIKQQARELARPGRRIWLGNVYEANFRQHYPSLEDFLVALLDG